LGFFFSSWNYNTEALTPDDIATYARDYPQPGAWSGALETTVRVPERLEGL